MLTEDKHEHSQEEHRLLCFYARVEVHSAQRLHDVDDVLLISCEPQYFIFKGSNGLSCEFSHDEKGKTEVFKNHIHPVAQLAWFHVLWGLCGSVMCLMISQYFRQMFG